ncbi:unnamed protein product [Tuber melanosporum]|uniref:(Perigord truffle) hypothetical protein n=1 Tax=Tuber melanosporum (strain Mel28) TaxID=656061 RepID=D5G9E7_TUBMM|nr:uncharacterized protein GSTUM_00003273001 [Tuber melanosporum]CAZ81140.1 unnamed protein product [Tuber melanosporum]
MSSAFRSISGRIASNLHYPVCNRAAALTRQHLHFQTRNIQLSSVPSSAPSAFRRISARNYATGPRKGGETGGSKNPFPIIPLLAILVAGSGGFYFLVQSRKEPMPAIEEPSGKPRLAAGDVKKPAFGPGEVSVIFVLGGPGAGKGTQCQSLVRDYGFVHLSAGDLLRAEQNREGSEFGELIKTYIREGKIVPMEVTVALLENAMRDAIAAQQKTVFLIDGSLSPLTLFFECPEDTLLQRLLKRGETSGRIDDNIESIKKRFHTFEVTSMPVVDYYEKKGKVVRIDASSTREGVYLQVQKQLADKLKA